MHSLQVFIMGRTIPSFRITTILEEKEWDNLTNSIIGCVSTSWHFHFDFYLNEKECH